MKVYWRNIHLQKKKECEYIIISTEIQKKNTRTFLLILICFWFPRVPKLLTLMFLYLDTKFFKKDTKINPKYGICITTAVVCRTGFWGDFEKCMKKL